jgi:hypothetical protein
VTYHLPHLKKKKEAHARGLLIKGSGPVTPDFFLKYVFN